MPEDVVAAQSHIKTLGIWAARLEQHKDEAIAAAGEQSYNDYMRYLTGCQYYFVDEALDVSLVTYLKQAPRRPEPRSYFADGRRGDTARCYVLPKGSSATASGFDVGDNSDLRLILHTVVRGGRRCGTAGYAGGRGAFLIREIQKVPPRPKRGDFLLWSDSAGAYSSVKLRVTAGSTGIPGPVVVETTTFFR